VTADQDRILVIKLSALGDFVQALGPMSAIRTHHAHAHMVLLTTQAYADFAIASGLFDDVWIDRDTPKAWQIGPVLRLRKKLKNGRFKRVYDLQTSDRSSFYFFILGPGKRPEWCGIAKGCSHPHSNPERDRMHTVERQREQLAMAGIQNVPAPDLSWAKARIERFGVKAPYALLVPGGAAHRPNKRWPEKHYADLANHMLAKGLTPVLLGAQAELAVLQFIALDAPGSMNLSGQTDFLDLAVLAQGAAVSVGNDTGPMHLIAAAGCACVVVYTSESDPALCAQRGPFVQILRSENLQSLTEAQVWEAVTSFVETP